VRALLASLALILVITACGNETDSTESQDENTATTAADETADDDTAADDDTGTVEELYPDVVDVSAEQAGDETWTFLVTLSSPYDSPERYADAWRVVGPDGEVYGERILLHDHANEQPFTRNQSGIEIPDGVTEVTVEGRDQISGWGGQTMTFQLPG
jgi:hypothetical protein